MSARKNGADAAGSDDGLAVQVGEDKIDTARRNRAGSLGVRVVLMDARGPVLRGVVRRHGQVQFARVHRPV